MNLKVNTLAVTAASLLLGLSMACNKDEPAPDPAPVEPPKPALIGVDMEKKIAKVGTLNDESGPGAAIGKPFAVGKRILAASVNAGGSGLLPDGWTLEMVEKDHGYNPQQSVQSYNEIKDDVLYIGTSFGTQNTMPLLPLLQRDKLVAFPASLSSEMAKHEQTPPLGASYHVEAQRAMDWAVAKAGSADKIKAGIVYQQDDYGADGLAGWKAAAALHGVEIVSEQTVAPGQSDMTAVITALKDAGATTILLTVIPSATGPLLGTAAQLQYMPTWIGNTPAWIDAFFNPKVIPAAVFTNYYWVTSAPFWGEDVPGMDKFIAAYEAHGKTMHAPDFYILISYIQGLAQIEALNRAITSGDVSRDGYIRSLHTLKGWDGGGLIQPFDLSAVPYVVGTRTRVLKPKMAEQTWDVVADHAEPMAEAYKPAAAGSAAPPNKGNVNTKRTITNINRKGPRDASMPVRKGGDGKKTEGKKSEGKKSVDKK